MICSAANVADLTIAGICERIAGILASYAIIEGWIIGDLEFCAPKTAVENTIAATARYPEILLR
jgi:hypothetical protein